MVYYYCHLLSSCCCQALNSKTVHHHEEQELMRMSVEYSPQSWEDSQSDAMLKISFRRREVDLTYNNDDEMVIMMKM